MIFNFFYSGFFLLLWKIWNKNFFNSPKKFFFDIHFYLKIFFMSFFIKMVDEKIFYNENLLMKFFLTDQISFSMKIFILTFFLIWIFFWSKKRSINFFYDENSLMINFSNASNFFRWFFLYKKIFKVKFFFD